ncbi:MAG: uracil-DNA glycosylase family protein [Gammaproteobacteria bacterium]
MNTSHANCTLPDHLEEGLEIVSIGLNPSWYSVEQGFYFARPANRFWKALNSSGLIPEALVPSPQAVERRFRTYTTG